MRRWFLGLAVALVAAGTAAADDKAVSVVKKAIDAHGGADNLNKYKAGKFKMAGELSVLGMDLEFTGSLAYSLPDRYRLQMNLEIMGQKMEIEQVVKGETAKSMITVAGMKIPAPGGDAEKEELKTAAAIQEAEQLTPLLDAKKFEIKAADDADVNGKKAAVIVVQPKAVKKEIKLYFDKESGLLVKTAHKGMGPGEDGQPKEVDEESYGADYKKVKGVQVPTKLTVNHDGKKFMVVKISDYELVDKIDDKEFTIDD
jgi:outer membrane lipoprotein-sorting protein